MKTPKGAILGLWDGHEAGVAILQDGALVFALSEERPSRRKRASGFPSLALAKALDFSATRGIPITDVALAGRWGRAPLRLLEPWYAHSDPHRSPFSLPSRLVRAWENRVAQLPGARALESNVGILPVLRRVATVLGSRPRFHVVPHHDAHAASALLGGIRDDTLVVTWDAYGEGVAATARTHGGPPQVLPFSAGVASLYGGITVALGFKEGDEGKVMGLACRGDPEASRDRFLGLFHVRQGAPELTRPLTFGRVRRLLEGLSREDAAAGLQEATERLAGGWVQTLLDASPGPVRLLLAGGLFANVRLNQHLSMLPGVRSLYVFPNMGDGGLAAGAACATWMDLTGAPAQSAQSMALGVKYSAAQAELAARASHLPWRRVPSPVVAAAARLCAGQVVCLHSGRDEFGPRALGQRSILFSPQDPGLPERVNEGLGRDGFMPFAPVLLSEQVSQLLSFPGADLDLTTMTVAVDGTDRFRETCPAAVHLDGSTRPQVVPKDGPERVRRILEILPRLGGPPALINTSFNLHGEPIVHTPGDALRTFARSGFDALYMGDLEIRGEHAPH